ncbi:hypothetical protein ACFQ0G_53760 [Streptomyces chiangmaiensis]
MAVMTPARIRPEADYRDLTTEDQERFDDVMERADTQASNGEYLALMLAAASIAGLRLPYGSEIRRCACSCWWASSSTPPTPTPTSSKRATATTSAATSAPAAPTSTKRPPDTTSSPAVARHRRPLRPGEKPQTQDLQAMAHFISCCGFHTGDQFAAPDRPRRWTSAPSPTSSPNGADRILRAANHATQTVA